MNPSIKSYLAQIGRIGGSVKSEAKQTASRMNGKLGGRPKLRSKRKVAAARKNGMRGGRPKRRAGLLVKQPRYSSEG